MSDFVVAATAGATAAVRRSDVVSVLIRADGGLSKVEVYFRQDPTPLVLRFDGEGDARRFVTAVTGVAL